MKCFFCLKILMILLFVSSCQDNSLNGERGQQSYAVKETENQEILLKAAVKENDMDDIYKIINGGANPDTVLENKTPIIIWAAINQNEALVKLLASKGADLNKKSRDGYLLFNIALRGFSDDSIKYLMSNNVDLLYTDEYCDYVAGSLISAIRYGREQIIYLLLDNDAVWHTVENKEIVGITLVRYWKDGYGSVFEALEKKGYKIPSKQLMLKKAIFEIQHGAVKWLLENGASPLESGNDEYFKDQTPLELAMYNIKRLSYQFTPDAEFDEEKIKKATEIKTLLESYNSGSREDAEAIDTILQ